MALFVKVWGDDPRLREQVLRINQLEPELLDSLGIEDDAMRMIRSSMEHLKTHAAKEQA
jgi:hypothetical protein